MLTTMALTGVTSAAMAQEGSDWLAKERFQLRIRAIDVNADGDGTVAQNGLKTDVDASITPEVDVTRRI